MLCNLNQLCLQQTNPAIWLIRKAIAFCKTISRSTTLPPYHHPTYCFAIHFLRQHHFPNTQCSSSKWQNYRAEAYTIVCPCLSDRRAGFVVISNVKAKNEYTLLFSLDCCFVFKANRSLLLLFFFWSFDSDAFVEVGVNFVFV